MHGFHCGQSACFTNRPDTSAQTIHPNFDSALILSHGWARINFRSGPSAVGLNPPGETNRNEHTRRSDPTQKVRQPVS